MLSQMSLWVEREIDGQGHRGDVSETRGIGVGGGGRIYTKHTESYGRMGEMEAA